MKQAQETSICFTGHRPKSLPWGSREDDPRCRKLKAALSAQIEALYESGFRHFLCGMALGSDLLFAEAVLELRLLHPELTLEAVIPCADQARRWPAAERARYEAILRRCNRVTTLQEHYTPDCMQRRNRYMVDHSAALLGVFSGVPGGTMQTVLYARRQGLPCILLDPEAD